MRMSARPACEGCGASMAWAVDEGIGRRTYRIRRTISVAAGARNHLQADRSLGFCFEIRI